MFKHVFIILIAGAPVAYATKSSPTAGLMIKCTVDLEAKSPTRVREALQKLVYLPLDPSAPPDVTWTARALKLVMTSPELGGMAALVYLRFTDPTAWADVRTLTDFVRLPADRRARFKADLRRVLAPFRYVAFDEVHAVERIPGGNWRVRGALKYTRKLPAPLFGQDVRLDGDDLTDVHALVPVFSGRNVVSSTHRVRLPAPGSPDLAYVDFEVIYAPGADENQRRSIQVDTLTDRAAPGRLLLDVPRPNP